MCAVGRRLMERGLIAGAEGNIAVRLDADRVLVTPAGRAKGALAPDDLVEVDLAGRRVRGAGRASSELDMHLTILRARPDVRAVVHAHPPTATGMALAGQVPDGGVLPEVIVSLGSVPIVPYGQPGSPELAERLRPYLAGHDALLLANHGAVTMGPTLDAAHFRMESLEQAARIVLVARLLGRVEALAPEDVARLIAQREGRGREANP
ncbi:MAG: class II aldolase/adducin family protein [Gemmatimonadetes bacterium]|nr:class II aldolase/adducin family protein [Gemmatimonadota bacterium]MBI4543015.1 class II aldolase/adducin family protein [Gemmatimonadota bacterium]